MTAASADLRELAADLAYASGQGIQKSAASLIQETAMKVQQYAAADAPRRTGKLAASIQIRYVDVLSAEISPTVVYGTYQEFGTGTKGEFPGQPYEIRPKAKPFLSFMVNGKRVYARVVHHQGVKAQPFMRPAAVQALDPFAGELIEKGLLLITKGPRSAL